MADNVAITPGSGNTIAADEVNDGTLGTVKVQYVKLMDGALDGTSKAVVNSNGLRVDLTGSTLTATGNALDVNVKSTTGSQPNNINQVGGAAFALGQAVMASSLPITLASNQPAISTVLSVSNKITYSAAATAAMAALATDVIVIGGSATKIIRILALEIFMQATAAASVLVLLIKRSTADTAGTQTSATKIPHDSTDAAATASVLQYTANPTVGTAIGNVARLTIVATQSTTTNQAIWSEDFGRAGLDKGIVLRGTAEQLAVNFNGVTLAGGVMNVNVIWSEE